MLSTATCATTTRTGRFDAIVGASIDLSVGCITIAGKASASNTCEGGPMSLSLDVKLDCGAVVGAGSATGKYWKEECIPDGPGGVKPMYYVLLDISELKIAIGSAAAAYIKDVRAVITGTKAGRCRLTLSSHI